MLEPFFAPTIENEWTIKTTVANGPVVFMERLDRHRLPNGWAELPVTGVFAVHDGQITAWRDYFDLSTLQTGFAEHARVCSAPPPSRKRRTVMTEFTTRWCEATMGRIPCARPEVALAGDEAAGRHGKSIRSVPSDPRRDPLQNG